MNWYNVSRLFHQKLFHNSVLNFSVFGTLGPLEPHRGVQMGVNHISMHFRHNNIEPKANEISKLNFRIWANGCFLAGLYVKTKMRQFHSFLLSFLTAFPGLSFSLVKPHVKA